MSGHARKEQSGTLANNNARDLMHPQFHIRYETHTEY
jgi:hypothetical protein